MLASVLNNPTGFDPANGQGRQEGASRSATTTCSTAWPTSATITEEQAEKAQKRLPKFPKITAEDTYGGQKGHLLTMVRERAATRLGLHRGGDRRRRPQGRPRRSTRRRMNAAEDGVLAGKPEGFGDKQLHVGVASASSPAPARCAASTPARTSSQSQLNWAVAGGQAGLDVQAVRAGGRAQGRATRSRTPSTATRPIELPDGADGREPGRRTTTGRGQPAQGHRGLHQHRLRRHDRGHGRRPGEDHQDRQRHGHPSGEGQAQAARLPAPHARSRADHRRRARLADRQPDQHGQRLRDDRQRRRRGRAVTSSRRSSTPTARRATSTRSKTEQALGEDIAADVSYALQQVVETGTGTAALGARPPGRRQDRHRDQRPAARSPRRGSSATPRSCRPR